MSARRRRSVRIPSDVVLTARSLGAIAARFPAEEIADLIERLIDHLDGRGTDPDREPEPEMCRA